MPVDVIINRNAHGLATDAALRRTVLEAAVRGSARIYETQTLQELEGVARDVAALGTDGVVLAGGDGSHMAGISALSRAFGGVLPPTALAPCGTVCTVARNFGARGGARAWTERLVAVACAGVARVERRPTLHVRDGKGSEQVGFIFGAGLVARFFDVYDQAPIRGRAAAARIAARVFGGSFVGSSFSRQVLAPTACEISINAVPHTWHRWSLVLASVVRDVGLHLLVAYRAGEAKDRFHVVASGLPPRKLARQMPRVFAGRPMRGEPHVDVLARSLRICFEAPLGPYVLDGDVFFARDVRVEPGPELPLLVP